MWRSVLITCPGRDLGLSYGALDMFRCKRLLENVEATFMDGAVFILTPLFCNLFLYLLLSPFLLCLSRTPLDSDDLLYLKEQMEAEEDAERLLRRTEKPVADSSPASVPLPLRVEPKAKSGIRQHDLLKRVVEVKPKRQRVTSPSEGSQPSKASRTHTSPSRLDTECKKESLARLNDEATNKTKVDNPVTSLLAAYESSDED
nr:uncharacterized protein LOC109167014 [Ipomoea batatas]